MIQCSECEHFHEQENGEVSFTCNPFHNIKEPECLAKWQLIKLDMLVQCYQATVKMYERIAPMQEKMFRHMEREIEDQEETDRWKLGEEDEEEQGDER